MKKNLLKVFLLSAATVGMVFSSCTNYDDDINDLNQKIEDLSGNVALKADQSAVQALEQKLAGIDFSKYVTKEGLDAAIKGVEDQTKSEIEAAIKGIKTLSENDVKSIFNEQMKAYDVWGSVNTKVADAIQEALKGTLKQSDINTIIAAAVAEINKDGSDIQKAILSIVGKDMEAALANYVTKDVLNGYVTAEAANAKYTAMEAAVEAKLDAANKALVAEITKQIADNNTIQKADLDKAFAEYDKEIASLWSAVSNLANRIQSIVYVPTSADGVVKFGNYNINGTPLSTGAGTKTTMVFRVSPASLAEALASGYNKGDVKMAFLPEQVTRAAETAFVIEGDVTAKDGKIEMLVSTNYTYPSATETYSIALQVIDSKKQEGETIETGTEFTTEYIPTSGSGSVNVYDNIVLVDEKLKVVTAISDKIEYDNTTSEHTFLAGYKYGYKVADNNVITLAEAAAKYNWDVTPEETPLIERTAFTYTGVTNLDVKPENPMANDTTKATPVTVSLEQATAGNIGKVVTDEGKLGIQVDTVNIFGTKNYVAKLNITKKQLKDIKLNKVTFVWDYAHYNSGSAYVADSLLISSELTFEQFKDLDFDAASWTLKTSDIKTANPGISMEIARVSTPSADNDVQLIKLSVNDYKKNKSKRHESIAFEGTVPVSTVAEVKFSGEIEFKGLPSVQFPISVPAGEYTVDGDNLVVEIAEHFSDSLYKVNETALKEHFNNGANFVSFMSSATLAKSFPAEKKRPNPTATAVDYAGLALATANGALNAYFVSSFIDFNDLGAYTFKVQPSTNIKVADAGFTVKFIKDNTVTINKDNNFFLMKGTDLYTPDGKTPYVVATGVRDGANYTIGNIDLDKAYKASKAGAFVGYELAARPANYTGPYPTFINGTTLNWNGCSFNSVEVTARLIVDGILVDVKKFNATIENPIVGPAVQAFVSETGEELNVVKVAANQAASISLLKGVTLKDFADSLVIDPVAGALDAESVSTYDVTVTYGTPAYKVKKNGAFVADNTISFDRLSVAGGVLSVSASDARLAHEIEVTVPVKLTHKYSVEKKTTGTTSTWERKPIEFDVVFIVKNAE